MKRVVIESPYALDGKIKRNLRYLRACMADAFKKGEAPYASHGLYTQPGVLDDTIPEERKLGMEAGFIWGADAALRAFYANLGVTPGMLEGEKRARAANQAVEVRWLAPDWDTRNWLVRWWEDVAMVALVKWGLASW